MPTKILLSGAKGRMGQAISSIATEHDCEVTIPIDINDDPNERMNECDVVIDFSLRDATLPLALAAATHQKPMVIGTTGHSQSDQDQITSLTESIPIIWAGNFSTGVNLLFYLTQKASKVLDQKVILILKS